MAYLALFVALGGTTYAATSLPDNSVGNRQLRNGSVTSQKIRDGSVTGTDVADKSLTGAQIDSTTLGPVSEALHAGNSDQLGGVPASDFRLHCPTALNPAGDLCFEFTERPSASLPAALATCARAQLRLPNLGELALVFDHLGAKQDDQWAADFFETTALLVPVGAIVGNDSSRELLLHSALISSSYPYRCVTSASN